MDHALKQFPVLDSSFDKMAATMMVIDVTLSSTGGSDVDCMI